jgi:hypothetical protein
MISVSIATLCRNQRASPQPDCEPSTTIHRTREQDDADDSGALDDGAPAS